MTPARSERQPALRLDKWLWQARFFKTRALSAEMVADGKIRVNTARVRKPATPVRVGDGLTIVQGQEVRTVRVTGSIAVTSAVTTSIPLRRSRCKGRCMRPG